jgi:hypothetical protein
MATKLEIGRVLGALDLKDRNFLDKLPEEEAKHLSPYMMIRWGAAVDGSPDLQAYYLMSANERLNKHFFDISTSEHKKLQWLLSTTISPGMGKQRHNWLAGKKKSNNSKAEKFLRSLFPHHKEDEIELLGRLNTTDDLKQLAREHGWDEKRIKAEL